MSKAVRVSVGDLVFCREDGPSVGAVRGVQPQALLVDIEGLGDISIAAEQVQAVHEGKVVLNFDKLAPEVQQAIAHANDDESLYR